MGEGLDPDGAQADAEHLPSKRLSLRQKFEAFVHLTYYMVHPLMVASFVLALLATFLNVNVINYAVHVSIPSPGAFFGSPGW